MTFEQRKLELITWITTIRNEELLERIEDFRNNPGLEIPDIILELLHESGAAKNEDCIEHTTSRKLLGRK